MEREEPDVCSSRGSRKGPDVKVYRLEQRGRIWRTWCNCGGRHFDGFGV